MEGSIIACMDYFGLLVAASVFALLSAVVTAICVKREARGACVVVGSSLLWFCTGRCVLLGEVGVKSGISIYPGPLLTGHTEKDENFAETGHNADTNISLR